MINASTDAGEAIEIAGVAGTDLDRLDAGPLQRQRHAGAATGYWPARIPLSGMIANQERRLRRTVVQLPAGGLQNGADDGIALVDAGGRVIQFRQLRRQRSPPPAGRRPPA